MIGTFLQRARATSYIAFAVEGLCYSAVVTRLPRIQREHGLSDGTINLLLLALPLAAAIGSLLAGRLMRGRGPGPVLRFTQPLLCLATLAAGTVGPPPLAVATLLIFGLAFGLMDAPMAAHGVAVQHHHGRSLVGGFFAVWSAAGIVGSLWTALANKLDLSLAAGFAIPALPLLILTVTTGHLLLRTPHTEQTQTRTTPWRPLLLIGAVMICAAITEAEVLNFAVKYLGDELHGSDSLAPLAVTGFMAAVVAGRAAMDHAVRRFGAPTTARAGAALGATGLTIAVTAPIPAVAIAGFTLTGLGICVISPLGYSAAGSLGSTAVARANVFNYAGFVLGPGLVAAVQPMSSYRIAYALPILLMPAVIVLARTLTASPAVTTPAKAPVSDAAGLR